MEERSHDGSATWRELGEAVEELLDATWEAVWNLQRVWQVAEAAIQGFAREPSQIGWEMSRERGRITGYEEGLDAERSVAEEIMSRMLPQYCIILGVAIIDGFVADFRRLFPRKQRPRGALFSLPVLPGMPQEDLDDTLYPVVGRYLEMRAARHLFVHNRGIIDQQYLDATGPLARGKLGEPYPLSTKRTWDALMTCSDLITTIRLLWEPILPGESSSHPESHDATDKKE